MVPSQGLGVRAAPTTPAGPRLLGPDVHGGSAVWAEQPEQPESDLRSQSHFPALVDDSAHVPSLSHCYTLPGNPFSSSCPCRHALPALPLVSSGVQERLWRPGVRCDPAVGVGLSVGAAAERALPV